MSPFARIASIFGLGSGAGDSNQGLRHELTAVNQFWLHYRLFDHWGYNKLAKKWRKESIEEMEHADRFVDRILFLEGFPNLQDLNP